MRTRRVAAVAAAIVVLAAGDEKPGVPMLVLDESAPTWVVDGFAGHSAAGTVRFQGRARQIGGLTRCAVAPAPDGSVYLATGVKWMHTRVLRVDPGGQARLIAGGGSSLADGPASRAKIMISTRAGALVYAPSNDSLYFVHTMVPAVRRLYRKNGTWMVETVAGNTSEAGTKDGLVKEARFKEPMSLAVTSTGAVYVLDAIRTLRKIEDGRVTTLATFPRSQSIIDGPFEKANMAITDMSGHITLGENDHTLYVADHWHFAARKIDLKERTVTTVAGKGWGNKPRFNKHADGPARTQAGFVSGCAYVCWDPVHKALWVGGPDEHRFRWLKDGRVKTVIGRRGNRRWPTNARGVPANDVSMTWSNVAAVDKDGGVYLVSASHHGVWRARQKKEGDQ